tara:strand:+ start:263 stop:574 length:312 start_codon:yes stop_codon:yes gene_type:complete
MYLAILVFLLQYVHADIIVEPYYTYNELPKDNTFAKMVITMATCTCMGVACSQKLFPIKVSEKDEKFIIESDKESTENYKNDIKKLKRDLREFQAILTRLDKT